MRLPAGVLSGPICGGRKLLLIFVRCSNYFECGDVNMKYAILAAAVLGFGAAQASAGEISSSSLSAIGLGKMAPVSNAKGMEVRAKGLVWGQSTASTNIFNIAGSTSTNGYVNWNFGTTVGANVSASYSAAGPFTAFSVAGGASFTN